MKLNLTDVVLNKLTFILRWRHLDFHISFYKNIMSPMWIHENINIELLMEAHQFEIILK